MERLTQVQIQEPFVSHIYLSCPLDVAVHASEDERAGSTGAAGRSPRTRNCLSHDWPMSARATLAWLEIGAGARDDMQESVIAAD